MSRSQRCLQWCFPGPLTLLLPVNVKACSGLMPSLLPTSHIASLSTSGAADSVNGAVNTSRAALPGKTHRTARPATRRSRTKRMRARGGGGAEKKFPQKVNFFFNRDTRTPQPCIQKFLPAGDFFCPNPPLSPLGPQTPPPWSPPPP